MAILLGTQSNGETLPVQVNEFGQLVAKGIKGEDGNLNVPDDPYEGAILGWKDGELAWVSVAVTLPAGTYGPYIYDLTSATLDVPQVPQLVAGQALYMSDEAGARISFWPQTSIIANVNSSDPTAVVLTTADNLNYELFTVGEVVAEPYEITAIDPTSNTIIVNGGAWTGSDGSGASSGFYASSITTGSIDAAFNGTITDDTLMVPVGGVFEIANIDSYSAASVSVNTNGIDSSATFVVTDAYGTEYRKAISNPGMKRDQKKCAESGGTWCERISQPNMWFEILFDTPTPIINIKVITGSTAGYINGLRVNGNLVGLNTFLGAGGGHTQVSLAASSGAATVSAVNGTTIELSDDNQQWIDGFYVTAPETRVAARKVAREVKKWTAN